ncbi:MAG: asnB1 [Gemmatimonadetes bacterium]|nr:asnB1 [Gemmatimonadota bacterium]
MCGITGYFGEFSPASLRGASCLIAHRGPDGEGEYVDVEAKVGLAHRRLAIIDLSPLGAQPMQSADGRVVLVFNGEIYNYRELRNELQSRGVSFRGHSDTEVLLALYLADGTEMLRRLNGIFAFALWDGRDGSLFVARDGMGVKPLYYSQGARGFAFSSETKGLLKLVPEARDLDVVALHRYMSFLWSPGAATPLRSVRKVLPGEAMIVRGGQIAKQWIWYSLPAVRGVQSDLSEGEAIAGTVAHLRAAVHRQLVADVPVGAFLSGGLDSSAVVAFAREQAPDIRCFTIETTGGHGDGFSDDLPYAQRVAAHLGVSLDVVRVDAGDMAGDLEGMVGQLDEPLADPAPLNVLYISRLAREQGIKVLLSGAGGDDLFTGYRRHLAVQAERYWTWLPRSVRTGLERGSARLDQRKPMFRRMAKLFDGAGLSDDARLTNYFLWTKESVLLGLYTDEFRAELAEAKAITPMLDFLAAMPVRGDPLNRMLALEQRFFLADHNLTYTDKMSMAVGVEARVPFLDAELVEFAARIPVSFKQRGRVGKWVLKKGMEPYLPRDVIYRPKSGFGAPLRHWMRHELRALMGNVLSPESLRRRGLFDPIAVQRLIDQNQSGKVDAAYTLLSLMSIEIWCRKYVDQAPELLPSPQS